MAEGNQLSRGQSASDQMMITPSQFTSRVDPLGVCVRSHPIVAEPTYHGLLVLASEFGLGHCRLHEIDPGNE